MVLAIDPALFYLIGEPTDPTEVWTKLENQFQKKSWANKLSMRRKLHSLRLKDGDSHVKQMTKFLVLKQDIAEEEEDGVSRGRSRNFKGGGGGGSSGNLCVTQIATGLLKDR